jgi:hypothetical protein
MQADHLDRHPGCCCARSSIAEVATTATDASSTIAVATASAVRMFSCPGSAAMTGTRRRRLRMPMLSGRLAIAPRTLRWSSSVIAAKGPDNEPPVGWAIALASRQYQ